MCAGDSVSRHARGAPCIYTHTHFYHRTLSALPHDELPTLEPGTRSRISARFMSPGHETPRACRGGAPRAGGRSPRPSRDVCAETLRLEGLPETRDVPSPGAGPSQNGTCSGGGIGRKIRAGRSAANYFRFVRTSVCIRESVCTERNDGFFGDRTPASSLIMVLFIDCEIVHASHMCVLALAKDLEARALKSSPQTKAQGNTPRAKARPTQDGRRGLQIQRERDGGCLAN